jgi:hypothetical protein
MSREVAEIIIRAKLDDLRKCSYQELLNRMNKPFSEFMQGPDGVISWRHRSFGMAGNMAMFA